jgi:hypothetical protein
MAFDGEREGERGEKGERGESVRGRGRRRREREIQTGKDALDTTWKFTIP